MAFQLWLADVLRGAGLTVREVPGWKTRGVEDFAPKGLIVHETQGSWTSSDAGEINVMVNGRAGLSGPIGHLYLSSTGHWHVVTAGFAHHVRVGWGGIFSGLGNHGLLGIEAQHGAGQPWTPPQYDSYVRGVAAILRHTGWKVAGHKEHQPGDKSDPGFDMSIFRADVAAAQMGDDMTPEQAEQLHNLHEMIFWNVRPWLESHIHVTATALKAIAERVDIDPAELDAIKAAAEAGAKAGVAATLTPETIAAAIPDDVAEQVVRLLAARLAQ